MEDYWLVHISAALRMTLAVVGGSLIGLNRYARGKPAGMCTHALVALGTAIASIAVDDASFHDIDALSRVLQGLVTGVGFIGAGVIMRNEDDHVRGLTTAASIWVAAIYGIAVGISEYVDACVGVALTLFVLIRGKPIEQAITRRFRSGKGVVLHEGGD